MSFQIIKLQKKKLKIKWLLKHVSRWLIRAQGMCWGRPPQPQFTQGCASGHGMGKRSCACQTGAWHRQSPLRSRASMRGERWAQREAGRQSKGCLAGWQQEPSGRTQDPGFRAGARHEFSMKHETWDHGNRLCGLEQLVSSPPCLAGLGELLCHRGDEPGDEPEAPLPGQGPAVRHRLSPYKKVVSHISKLEITFLFLS